MADLPPPPPTPTPPRPSPPPPDGRRRSGEASEEEQNIMGQEQEQEQELGVRMDSSSLSLSTEQSSVADVGQTLTSVDLGQGWQAGWRRASESVLESATKSRRKSDGTSGSDGTDASQEVRARSPSISHFLRDRMHGRSKKRDSTSERKMDVLGEEIERSPPGHPRPRAATVANISEAAKDGSAPRVRAEEYARISHLPAPRLINTKPSAYILPAAAQSPQPPAVRQHEDTAGTGIPPRDQAADGLPPQLPRHLRSATGLPSSPRAESTGMQGHSRRSTTSSIDSSSSLALEALQLEAPSSIARAPIVVSGELPRTASVITIHKDSSLNLHARKPTVMDIFAEQISAGPSGHDPRGRTRTLSSELGSSMHDFTALDLPGLGVGSMGAATSNGAPALPLPVVDEVREDSGIYSDAGDDTGATTPPVPKSEKRAQFSPDGPSYYASPERSPGHRQAEENSVRMAAQQVRKRRSVKTRGNWATGLGDQWQKQGKSILFLVILGILASGVDQLVRQSIDQLYTLRGRMLDHDWSYGIQFTIFASYMVTGTFLASLLTSVLAPDVAGSGLPFMKWLIGTDDVGAKAKEAFTLKAGCVKGLGLILAAGTGLSVGREGPFVHMAGVMAYQLLFRVPHFKDILENEGLFRQMLVSSTSLGIGATFAALIGGVLFTIEITSTYYLVAQYFKGFVAGLSGALAVICLDSLMTSQERAKQTLVLSAFTSDMYDLREMPAYFFIGCMCAALGQLYKHQRLFLLKYIRIMTSWNLRLARNPAQRWQFVRRTVIVSSSVAFISSMLMFFPGEYNRSGPFALFQDLISAGDLPDSFTSAAGGQNVALLLVFIMRWITSSLATSIVVPAGDFILLAGVGAAGGRLFGNMINHFYSGTFPATYALIGGAALSASATQSISSGLIILELTGASTMTIPTFVAVLAAVGFSRKLGRNLYDSVMETNGLKTLQGLNPDPEYIANRTASNIMVRDLAVVPCDSTVEYLVNRLEDVGKFVRFPVVSSLDTLVFQGVVDRGELARLLRRRGSRNNRFMSHVNKRLGQDMAAISTESQSNVFSISVALHSVYDTIKTIGRGAQQEEGDTGSISPTSQRTRRGRPKLTSLFESPNSTQRARSPLRMKSQRLSLAALEHGGWEEKNLKEAVMADMMRARVDLVSEWQNGGIYIDTSVWTVPENMPLGHLHVLFELLKATEVFVVDSSQLRGVITRDVLYEALRGSRPNSSYYYS